MDWDEFTNALEWYAAAPARWYESGKKDLQAAAEWIWTVLEGDFADEQTTAQIVTGTIISVIPFVDQICDVRDLIACCKKVHQDPSNRWAWVAVALTLIGLFPELGSLAKGGGKLLFAYGRKSVFRAGKSVALSGFWKHSEPFVEAGIGKLNQYLKRPAVRKTLKALSIHNPYHFLSGKVRELAASLSTGKLLSAFDKVLNVLRSLIAKVQRWGSDAMATRAGRLLQMIIDVRNKANKALGEVIAPLKHWMERLAKRLEVESDANYRAIVNRTNPHHFARASLDTEEKRIAKAKPEWVDVTKKLKYRALEVSPRAPKWEAKYGKLPDISDASNSPALKGKYDTFHQAKPTRIEPGETLYRIVDPGDNSYDNGVFWMREADFKALQRKAPHSKAAWRRKFAVWANWNADGQYVTYTAPPGKPLNVWEGPTASQQLRKGSKHVLEGGGTQLVVNPDDLSAKSFSERQPTGWGYGDFAGDGNDKLGLPVLKNNLYPQKPKDK